MNLLGPCLQRSTSHDQGITVLTSIVVQIIMNPSHILDQSHDVAALARVGAP